MGSCLRVLVLFRVNHSPFEMASKVLNAVVALAIIAQAWAFTIPENENFLNEVPHYHTDGEISDLFARLAKQYPDLAEVRSLGHSLEGRDLIVIHISKDVKKRDLLEPMFKYVANMHGDETVGRQLMVYLAEYLLHNYNSVPEVTRLVDTTDIYLMPSMNPDGFNRSKVSNRSNT